MKARLRTLRIEPARYAWTAQMRHLPVEGDCRRAIRVRVWGAGKNGCVLDADLLSTSEAGPWGYCATDTAFPTPRTIRILIDYALHHGWDPSRIGGRHVLVRQPGAEVLILPGFAIIDQLCEVESSGHT
jgi:hypothetical protein